MSYQKRFVSLVHTLGATSEEEVRRQIGSDPLIRASFKAALHHINALPSKSTILVESPDPFSLEGIPVVGLFNLLAAHARSRGHRVLGIEAPHDSKITRRLSALTESIDIAQNMQLSREEKMVRRGFVADFYGYPEFEKLPLSRLRETFGKLLEGLTLLTVRKTAREDPALILAGGTHLTLASPQLRQLGYKDFTPNVVRHSIARGLRRERDYPATGPVYQSTVPLREKFRNVREREVDRALRTKR